MGTGTLSDMQESAMLVKKVLMPDAARAMTSEWLILDCESGE